MDTGNDRRPPSKKKKGAGASKNIKKRTPRPRQQQQQQHPPNKEEEEKEFTPDILRHMCIVITPLDDPNVEFYVPIVTANWTPRETVNQHRVLRPEIPAYDETHYKYTIRIARRGDYPAEEGQSLYAESMAPKECPMCHATRLKSDPTLPCVNYSTSARCWQCMECGGEWLIS